MYVQHAFKIKYVASYSLLLLDLSTMMKIMSTILNPFVKYINNTYLAS